MAWLYIIAHVLGGTALQAIWQYKWLDKYISTQPLLGILRIYCLNNIFSSHSCSHIATCGQFHGHILDLQVVGWDDTKEVTVLHENATTVTGPISGTVNGITARFACYSKARLASNAQGTVDRIGWVCPVRAAVLYVHSFAACRWHWTTVKCCVWLLSWNACRCIDFTDGALRKNGLYCTV